MDYYKLTEKRSMTPEKMVKILENHGTVVSIGRAQKILELIYKLSNLSMKETLGQLPECYTKDKRKKFKRQTRKK
ncbi:hypothetical protein QFZ20_002286 [Flavobacterium sp. W4I14]|nr:hypothetical protein [Flavobacterium sp. W4I14]